MSSENRIKYLEVMHENLRVTKRAHAFAMERKRRFRLWLGLLSVVLSLLVASGLIEVLLPVPGAPDQASRSAIAVIKLLTFLAAVLTSALTLFNFEKEAETHLSALDVYSNLARDCGIVLARIKDGAVDPAQIDAEIEKLDAAYDKANSDFKNCPPWNRDFRRARKPAPALQAAAT
jgi:hypothetical protein